LLATTSFKRHLQYRGANLLATVGVVIVGFIEIAIWRAAAGPSGGLKAYSIDQLILWLAFGQAMFTLIQADTGLNIPQSIQTGAVATDLLRPAHYFAYVLTRETGTQLYFFLYRSIPVFLVYSLVVGYHLPTLPQSLLLIASVLLGLYVALCLHFLVGMSAFWTVDVRWTQSVHFSMISIVSGTQIPADLFPGVIGRIAPYLPWASLAHWPARIYLGMSGAKALLPQAAWALALTVICEMTIRTARHKLEVQGG
jgi:ABC-2 type transport system permease protein